MLDKVIYSIMQSPHLLKELMSGDKKTLAQYSLTSEETAILKDLFSNNEDSRDLSLAFAGVNIAVEGAGWWPPIAP